MKLTPQKSHRLLKRKIHILMWMVTLQWMVLLAGIGYLVYHTVIQ